MRSGHSRWRRCAARINGPQLPAAGDLLCSASHGYADIRAGVQPVAIKLEPSREGPQQKIDFAKPRDVKAGRTSIPLQAKSDRGLPVGFFVKAGPAKIVDNRLVFTPIPPRTKFPIEVTVAAWQWGRAAEPKVQQAEIVRQTFLIN